MPNKLFHVVGGNDLQISEMMRKFGLVELVDTDHGPTEADIVIFTGGADVHPMWYGERTIPGCHHDQERDDFDMEAYWTAYAEEKLCIGICRGAQLIHVANNGKMWQDVNGHGRTHHLLDIKSGETHLVTSTHHQMMRVDLHDPGNEFEIVAIAANSGHRKADGLTIYPPKKSPYFTNDIEVLWYPKARSLCFQPHPEYALASCFSYFEELLIRYGFITGLEQLDMLSDESLHAAG